MSNENGQGDLQGECTEKKNIGQEHHEWLLELRRKGLGKEYWETEPREIVVLKGFQRNASRQQSPMSFQWRQPPVGEAGDKQWRKPAQTVGEVERWLQVQEVEKKKEL